MLLSCLYIISFTSAVTTKLFFFFNIKIKSGSRKSELESKFPLSGECSSVAGLYGPFNHKSVTF